MKYVILPIWILIRIIFRTLCVGVIFTVLTTISVSKVIWYSTIKRSWFTKIYSNVLGELAAEDDDGIFPIKYHRPDGIIDYIWNGLKEK